MCNWARDYLGAVGPFLQSLGDEELAQLQGLVNMEIRATRVAPAMLAIIKVVVDDEASSRKVPRSQ